MYKTITIKKRNTSDIQSNQTQQPNNIQPINQTIKETIQSQSLQNTNNKSNINKINPNRPNSPNTRISILWTSIWAPNLNRSEVSTLKFPNPFPIKKSLSLNESMPLYIKLSRPDERISIQLKYDE